MNKLIIIALSIFASVLAAKAQAQVRVYNDTGEIIYYATAEFQGGENGMSNRPSGTSGLAYITYDGYQFRGWQTLQVGAIANLPEKYYHFMGSRPGPVSVIGSKTGSISGFVSNQTFNQRFNKKSLAQDAFNWVKDKQKRGDRSAKSAVYYKMPAGIHRLQKKRPITPKITLPQQANQSPSLQQLGYGHPSNQRATNIAWETNVNGTTTRFAHVADGKWSAIEGNVIAGVLQEVSRSQNGVRLYWREKQAYFEIRGNRLYVANQDNSQFRKVAVGGWKN